MDSGTGVVHEHEQREVASTRRFGRVGLGVNGTSAHESRVRWLAVICSLVLGAGGARSSVESLKRIVRLVDEDAVRLGLIPPDHDKQRSGALFVEFRPTYLEETQLSELLAREELHFHLSIADDDAWDNWLYEPGAPMPDEGIVGIYRRLKDHLAQVEEAAHAEAIRATRDGLLGLVGFQGRVWSATAVQNQVAMGPTADGDVGGLESTSRWLANEPALFGGRDDPPAVLRRRPLILQQLPFVLGHLVEEFTDTATSIGLPLSIARAGGLDLDRATRDRIDSTAIFEESDRLVEIPVAVVDEVAGVGAVASRRFRSVLPGAPSLEFPVLPVRSWFSASPPGWRARTASGALIELDQLSAAEQRWARIAIELSLSRGPGIALSRRHKGGPIPAEHHR